MSNSRLEAGTLSLGEERPILTGEGLLDKDSWVDSLKSYPTTMNERAPDVDHPSMEWIAQGLSMISLDQGKSAAAVLPPNVTVAVRNVMTDIANQPITDMRKKTRQAYQEAHCQQGKLKAVATQSA